MAQPPVNTLLFLLLCPQFLFGVISDTSCISSTFCSSPCSNDTITSIGVMASLDVLAQQQAVQTAMFAVEELARESVGHFQLIVEDLSQETENEGKDVAALKSSALFINCSNLAAVLLLDDDVIQVASALLGAAQIPIISPSACHASSLASNKAFYPTLLPVCRSDESLKFVALDLIRYFAWKQVVLVHSAGLYRGALAEVVAAMAPQYSSNANLTRTVSIQLHPSYGNESSLQEASLKELSRIRLEDKGAIFLLVREMELLPTIRAAQTVGLLNESFSWVRLSAADQLPVSSPVRALIDVRASVGANCERVWQRMFSARATEQRGGPLPSTLRKMRNRISALSCYSYDSIELLATFLFAENTSTRAAARNTESSTGGLLSLLRKERLPSGRQGVRRMLAEMKAANKTGQASGVNLTKPYPKLEKYSIYVGHEGKERKVGNWSEYYRLALSHRPSDRATLWNFYRCPTANDCSGRSKLLKIVLLQTAPCVSASRTKSGKLKFRGLVIDVIRKLAKSCGFKFKLSLGEDGRHRNWLKTMERVGNAKNGLDMVASCIVVNPTRARVCQFTTSYYQLRVGMLVKRTDSVATGMWSFFHPFHWTVWFCIILVVFLSATVIMITDPRGVKTPRQSSLFLDSLFFSVSALFSTHWTDNITRAPAQVFLVVLQFFVVIIIASYTANMATILQGNEKMAEPVITSERDVYTRPVGCIAGGMFCPYLRKNLGVRKVIPLENRSEALSALRSGRIDAYFHNHLHVQMLAGIECDLEAIVTTVSKTLDWGRAGK